MPEDRDPARKYWIITQVCLGLIFGLAGLQVWDWLYVEPREEFLMDVLTCTGADSSEAAWKRCVEEVRAEKAAEVSEAL